MQFLQMNIIFATRYLGTTHFEATGARTAFPCFDEPEMKANFSMIMVKEGQHTALSNMPVDRIVRSFYISSCLLNKWGKVK